jgi:hypothetical protein
MFQCLAATTQKGLLVIYRVSGLCRFVTVSIQAFQGVVGGPISGYL